MRNFHFQSALLPEGWARDVTIAVDPSGLIADIAIGLPCPPFTDRLPGVAIPGIPNLHSHAHQRAMAGLTQRSGPTSPTAGNDTFWTWRDTMYRLVQAIDPDDLQAIATQAFIEMLQAGYTHVTEFHYLHHAPTGRPYDDPAELAHRIAAAAEATGIGLTLLPVLYSASGFDAAPCTPAQARFACTLDQFAALHARLPPGTGIAPHSLRAVPPGTLAAALALAPTGPIHIHIAEQPREVDECRATRGQRPVAWLLDHAQVDTRWCLVHATHIDEAERRSIASTGAIVGLCPTTEADLGDGIFPAATFQADGGRFGIGSDSQVSPSPLEELRLLEYTQRLALNRRTLLAATPATSTARTLLAAAATNGAAASDIQAGQIEIAHRADITILAAHPGLEGDNALDAAIFAPRGNPVRHVVVAGECVIRDGAHRLQAIAAARFGKVLEKLGSA